MDGPKRSTSKSSKSSGPKSASKSTVLSRNASLRSNSPGLSRATSSAFTVSVEPYMLEGMNETLGDVLEKQLVHTHLVTRPTQTDWQWRLMAERWKHGAIRYPRPKPWGFEASPIPPQETVTEIRRTIIGKEVIVYPTAKSKEWGIALPNIEMLRDCTDIEKCIDTSDLDFDPYDPNIQYVKSRSTLKPLYIPPAKSCHSAEDSSQWFLPTDRMLDL